MRLIHFLVVSIAVLGFVYLNTSPASAQSQMTCKAVEVVMPSGFGNGSWHLSKGGMVYPRMSVAEFQQLGKLRCPQQGPTRRGYQIRAFHVAEHGAVTARIKIQGCAPDGRHVSVNVPLQLPNPPGRIVLDKGDVRVAGRCGP